MSPHKLLGYRQLSCERVCAENQREHWLPARAGRPAVFWPYCDWHCLFSCETGLFAFAVNYGSCSYNNSLFLKYQIHIVNLMINIYTDAMVLLFRNLIIIKAFRKCAISQNRIHQISSPYIPARLGEGLRGSC